MPLSLTSRRPLSTPPPQSILVEITPVDVGESTDPLTAYFFYDLQRMDDLDRAKWSVVGASQISVLQFGKDSLFTDVVL